SIHTTRVELKTVDVKGVTEIAAASIEAARLLATAPLNVIVLGCTSGSFINGSEYDKNLIRSMEEVTNGIPCTTTASAVSKALDKLKVNKLAVVTPYVEEINLRAIKYLQEKGFKVLNLAGLGLIEDYDINRQDLETVYNLAKSTDVENADGIFIACTGIRSIPIIKTLEKDLNKPVISAIQATFWDCLRLSGVHEKISGYGCLLENF
ncbi:MAG: Asp/Glu racemase, partial [Clostridia bacterium]|nr:Asp/Glu racemase [Clostridia bacterium]